MATKFNPFGIAATSTFNLIEDLTTQVQSGAIRLNKDGNVEPLKEGDGTAAIEIRLSVRTGGASNRGASRLDLQGDQVGSVTDALRAFDPESKEDLTGLSPAECVRRSIQVEPVKDQESVVSFKLSLKDHARAVKIPVSQWDDFLGFMDGVGEWTAMGVQHYRELIAKQEAAANASEE